MATKKPAPKKKVAPAKKAAPAKKTVSAPKAAAAKKPVSKAASPKKPAPAPVKKAAVKTAVAKKPAPAPVKKSAAVVVAPKKAASAPAKKAVAKPAAVVVAPKKGAPAPAKKAVAKPAAVVVAPKKAAPAKKAVAKPAAVVVAPKKAAPAPVKKPDAKPVAKAEVKGVSKTQPKPAAKSEVKTAPKAQAKPEVKATPKPTTKPAKPAVPAKPAKPAKKIPTIAPEIRFAETSKAAVSPAELRKALRAKESKKETKPVAMPKINTKSARKYEPEFMKSVLDAKVEPIVLAGPTQRYSDGELLEFRELIQNKLNAAKQELAYLNGLITRKDSMSGEDSDTRYMTMEDGSLSMEREQLSQMASRQIDFIEKLEKAMMRIQNKTYGICRVTGKLIDKARLRAVPHATLSMEAKTGINRPGSSF